VAITVDIAGLVLALAAIWLGMRGIAVTNAYVVTSGMLQGAAQSYRDRAIAYSALSFKEQLRLRHDIPISFGLTAVFAVTTLGHLGLAPTLMIVGSLTLLGVAHEMQEARETSVRAGLYTATPSSRVRMVRLGYVALIVLESMGYLGALLFIAQLFAAPFS
jgi:hypothetical protein